MKPEISLILPYPPSVNSCWRTIRIKGVNRTILSAAVRKYRDKVCNGTGYDKKPLEGRLKVEIGLVMPDRRTRDIDNPAKGVLDALTHLGVWVDDSQIDDLRMYRMYIQKPGAAYVDIYTL